MPRKSVAPFDGEFDDEDEGTDLTSAAIVISSLLSDIKKQYVSGDTHLDKKMRNRIEKTIAITNNYYEMQNILIKRNPFRHHKNTPSKHSDCSEIVENPHEAAELSDSDTSDSDNSNSTDLVVDTLKMAKNSSTARRHQSMLVRTKESSKWLDQYSNLHIHKLQQDLI